MTDISQEAVALLAGVVASRSPNNTDHDQHRSATIMRAQSARIAKLEKALADIADGYGPNHMSKFARDTAQKALTQ